MSIIIKDPLEEIEIRVTPYGVADRRTRERFLKGPIPMSVLWDAASLPGPCLAVYLAIRHQADMSRSYSVAVPSALLRKFGVNKDAKSRSLRRLAEAGLISVDQSNGRSARVQLLSPSPSNAAQSGQAGMSQHESN